MRFDLTADQKLLQSSTAGYLDAKSPMSRVRELAETTATMPPGFWERGAELGWTSFLVPESLGGGSVSGDGLIDATIIAEELGRRVAPGPFGVTNTVAAALANAANAQDFGETIDGLMLGALVATWACYSPGRGWQPDAVDVRAEVDGDVLRLDGVHDRVQHGAEADSLLVLARTGDGLTQVLVPAGTDGVVITPERSLDLVRPFARVEYRDVTLPLSAVVGEVGQAAAAVERQFQLMVVLQCAELVGTMQRVLEITRQWLFDRYSFGRPLASYQALKHRYADMVLISESAQATMAGAARAVQDDAPDAAHLVGTAKAWIGQRATELIQECVQFHGGIGVTWEHDLHIYLRRATVDRVTWGTPSEHRRRLADLMNV